MKKMKLFLVLVILSMLFWTTNAATIDKIEAIDNNTIQFTASSEVLFSDINVEWDIKLLKDIPVSFSVKDIENFKKIIINLWDDLITNNSYSLITILWANWNIDFTTPEYLWGEIINSNLLDGEEWLEKINIIDSRTIELFFNTDLVEDIFEFKILSDIATEWLVSSWNNVLNLDISESLEESTLYIIMILSLKDVMWNILSFDEDLYDLLTPEVLIKDINTKKVVIPVIEEEIAVEEWNIEEIALNSAKTPETGTATSVLILLAVIANLAFFFRKKFIK